MSVTSEASVLSGSPDARSYRYMPAGISGRSSNQELKTLAERMQKELNIRDRKWRLRKYKQCFVGSEAVEWLIEQKLAADVTEAEHLGNEMLQLGLLHHVTYKHSFKNKYYFYRFLEVESTSEADEDGPESDGSDASDFRSKVHTKGEKWSRRSDGLGRLAQGEKWSVGSDVARLQRRLADLTTDFEDQRDIYGTLLDAISEQIRGMQTVTSLLTQRLANANARVERLQWLLFAVILVQIFTIAQLTGHTAGLTAPSAVFASLAASLATMLSLAALARHRTGAAKADALKRDAEAALQRDKPIWMGDNSKWIEGLSPVTNRLESADAASSTRSDVDARASPARLRRLSTVGEESLPSPSRGRSGPRSSSSSPGKLQMSNGEVPTARQSPGSKSAAAGKLIGPSVPDGTPPAQEDFAGWQDAPFLLRPRPLGYQRCEEQDWRRVAVNTGRAIPFETDLMVGKAVVWVANVPSAPKNLFAGQRRQTSITVQGRFKRPLSLEDTITGQDFSRPAVNLPAKWLLETVLVKMAQRISPSMSIGPMSAPYVVVPLVALAQEINVAQPGSEPDPTQQVPEDMRLFDEALADKDGGPLPAGKRKRHFWNPANRAGRAFTTEHVWTFSMFQDKVDMGAYELKVPIARSDLTRYLDGQPLQFMLKDRTSGEYLFSFEAWHERLLQAAQEAEERAAAQ